MNTPKAKPSALCPHCRKETLYVCRSTTYQGELSIYRENVAEHVGKLATCDNCGEETRLGREQK